MKLTANLAVSLLCMLIITTGLCYAYERESVRQIDLTSEYARINQQSFHGSLPPVDISWGDLSEKRWEAATFGDGSGQPASIVIDRNAATSKHKLDELFLHEICHVATWQEEADHGANWIACAARVGEDR